MQLGLAHRHRDPAIGQALGPQPPLAHRHRDGIGGTLVEQQPRHAARAVAAGTRLAAVGIEEPQRDIGIRARLDQQQLVEPDAAMPVADPAHGGLVQGDGRTPAVQHDEVVAAAMHLHERDRSHAPGG